MQVFDTRAVYPFTRLYMVNNLSLLPGQPYVYCNAHQNQTRTLYDLAPQFCKFISPNVCRKFIVSSCKFISPLNCNDSGYIQSLGHNSVYHVVGYLSHEFPLYPYSRMLQ